MAGGWTHCCASSHEHPFPQQARSTHGSSHDPWTSTHRRSSSYSAKNRSTRIGSSAPSNGPGNSPIRRPGEERRARGVCEPSASKSSVASSEDDSSPRTWLFENGRSGRARPPDQRRGNSEPGLAPRLDPRPRRRSTGSKACRRAEARRATAVGKKPAHSTDPDRLNHWPVGAVLHCTQSMGDPQRAPAAGTAGGRLASEGASSHGGVACEALHPGRAPDGL